MTQNTDMTKTAQEERRGREDALYANEPWAALAVEAGYRPYDTESSARDAFEFAAERLATAEAEIAALRALVFQQGENAAKAATEYAENMAALRAENARLREALKPLAFLEFGKDEDEGVLFEPFEVWSAICRDRVADWFGCDEITASRAALTGARVHD